MEQSITVVVGPDRTTGDRGYRHHADAAYIVSTVRAAGQAERGENVCDTALVRAGLHPGHGGQTEFLRHRSPRRGARAARSARERLPVDGRRRRRVCRKPAEWREFLSCQPARSRPEGRLSTWCHLDRGQTRRGGLYGRRRHRRGSHARRYGDGDWMGVDPGPPGLLRKPVTALFAATGSGVFLCGQLSP